MESLVLPEAFTARISEQLKGASRAFVKALNHPAPVSIRINELKTELPTSLEKMPWSNSGFYLKERPSFTLDPLFHAGTYYVQEASSMFLEQAILQTFDINQSLTVLDLCAAPGGKSTHLSSLLSTDSLLVSNEVIRTRANILAENLQKWGKGNAIVTNNDPKAFQALPHFFDAIVVDAPCSGEGLFRKDANAVNEWSEANVKLCAERQRRILMDVWESLKPGGILIYSTCTYNEQENEGNLQWLSKQHELEWLHLAIHNWNIEQSTYKDSIGYRFYPHQIKGEGFFMAVGRKAGEPTPVSLPKRGKKNKWKLQLATKQEKSEIEDWFYNSGEYTYMNNEGVITAFPQSNMPAVDLVYQNLKVVTGGIEVAKFTPKGPVPQHAFAISKAINKDYFTEEEVDLPTALKFLKREDVKPQNNERGWILLTFKNIPLGWIKGLGNRANNYYPKEWRIRMQIPDLIDIENFPTH